jgi:transposase
MSHGATQFEMPEDLAACRALLAEQLAYNEELAAAVTELQERNEAIVKEKDKALQEKRELELYIQRVLLKRSERYIADPNQLKLDFGDTPETDDAEQGLRDALEESGQAEPPASRPRRPKRKPRREKLPDHLPKKEVVVPVPEEVSHCPTHGPRKLIGYDIVEKLVLEPPRLYNLVTKYPKFVCEDEPECGVSSPERPVGLVEGDRYDTSVATEALVGKYAFHMPIYRQQDRFAGSGWTPSRSTLLNLLVAAAFVLEPLVAYIRQRVLASPIVGTDDTRTILLLPRSIPPPIPGDARSERIHEVFSQAVNEGRRHVTARMWAYRSVTEPLTFFDFTVSRHRDGPDEVLADFTGTLLADCYSGYQSIELRSDERIRRAACNAHSRRKLFEARGTYPIESSWWLAKYQQLYDIEDRAKTWTPEDRLALRQAEAAPIWETMGEWLDSETARNLTPKSDFAQAIGYVRNHWDPLRRYLEDGRLPIDNNEVEQLMKQIAIGRKNWLFVGSVAAGVRAAGFFTLVASAVRNDLDVWAYVKDILDQLLAGETDYSKLAPDAWKASHPEAIREYRVEERRDRADRKQARRARRRAVSACEAE